jgi:hypothetical protein
VYTLVLKNDVADGAEAEDHVLPGRTKEGSTVSFEYNFSPMCSQGEEEMVHAPFSEFVAFYRGRPVENPPSLDLACVKRMSFMVRSFFGDQKQEGPFSLEVFSVAAVSNGNGDGDGGGL